MTEPTEETELSSIQSHCTPATLLARPTSCLVHKSRGAVRVSSHHAPVNQIQLRGVATQPAAHSRGGDTITSPPEHKPYNQLKVELVCRLSTSREQHMRQLLSHEEMGNRKPLQFLRHLKSLAPDVPDDFLRTNWASCLPPHVQAILAGQTEGRLNSASNLADRICKVTPQLTTVSVYPAMPDNTTSLLERTVELSSQVASLQASQTHSHSQSRDHHSQSRDRHLQSRDHHRWQFRDCHHSQSRDRHSNHDASLTPHDTCWYHSEFGDTAHSCRPPCSDQQGNDTSRH
jgi:hypothetical protein